MVDSSRIANSIEGKVLNIIYNLFESAELCMRNSVVKSDDFICNIGHFFLEVFFYYDFGRFIISFYKCLGKLSYMLKRELRNTDVDVSLYSLLYCMLMVQFFYS